MSVFGHPVWQHALFKFVEVSEQLAWIQDRSLEVDFVPNGVMGGTAVQWFYSNMLAHCDCSWGNYHFLVEQCNDLFAQLTLLHMKIKYMTTLEDDEDDAEEEASWTQNWVGLLSNNSVLPCLLLC